MREQSAERELRERAEMSRLVRERERAETGVVREQSAERELRERVEREQSTERE